MSKVTINPNWRSDYAISDNFVREQDILPIVNDVKELEREVFKKPNRKYKGGWKGRGVRR